MYFPTGDHDVILIVIDRTAPDARQAQLAADLQRRLQELTAEFRSRGYLSSRLARDLRQAARSLEED